MSNNILPDEYLLRLANARNVAILTGAGVSAESGIKTFRDPDGLWSQFNPQELASIEGFINNPKLVWSWYQHRVEIINTSSPNPGHFALAKMQDLYPSFALITQNVDRLHQRAGSKDVIELHGNIIENHCFDCKLPFEGDLALPDGDIPLCSNCGGRIRPNVVWFGEMLPVDAIESAELSANQCEVFLTIGTSAEVYPAANLPIIAKNASALVIEINPKSTPLSRYYDWQILMKSGEALPILIDEIIRVRNSEHSIN